MTFRSGEDEIPVCPVCGWGYDGAGRCWGCEATPSEAEEELGGICPGCHGAGLDPAQPMVRRAACSCGVRPSLQGPNYVCVNTTCDGYGQVCSAARPCPACRGRCPDARYAITATEASGGSRVLARVVSLAYALRAAPVRKHAAFSPGSLNLAVLDEQHPERGPLTPDSWDAGVDEGPEP